MIRQSDGSELIPTLADERSGMTEKTTRFVGRPHDCTNIYYAGRHAVCDTVGRPQTMARAFEGRGAGQPTTPAQLLEPADHA